jgi:serine/threonine protein kinase
MAAVTRYSVDLMSVDGPPAAGSEPQMQSPSLVGHILDGRYRIIRKIGEGGMGEVYAAEHVHIEKRFAIKLLRQEIVSNPEAVTRFRQEARSSSSIGHRNIIAIEDFGQLADGRIYMCMELLNGAALNDMITQPMGVDRLLNILIQTGHGLAAAHAKGIVHRDMKPENVFVTIGPNGEDVPKLLDFGIAKVAGNDGQNHLTRTGTIFGTPFYMAPEQALGNPVDARTDIYAVGVIMYECFAGSLPFQGDSFMGILTQHITVDPEPVAQRAAKAGRQLPPGLADVIMCCMQKNPAQRFSTMDDLVNVLIQIYRGIVGPGMSSYMEAFPVLPSAAHQVQPTPPPMTGGPRSGYVSAPMNTPPTGPVMVGHPSGPAMVVSAASSGMYAQPAPKSKLGVILAIVAVIVVGGGIAGFLIATNQKGGGGGGSGSGSQQIAGHNGSGDGSSQTGHDGSAASGSGIVAHVGSGSDAGSGTGHDGSGSDVIAHSGSDAGSQAGSAIPPLTVDVVQVLLSSKNVPSFEVFENGTKLFDGPDILEVPRGEVRNVVIKARGFKDKKLAVPGVKKPLRFALERQPGPVPVPVPNNGSNAGSNTTTHVPPPPQMDCTNQIVDTKNKACIKQYCDGHKSADKCQVE